MVVLRQSHTPGRGEKELTFLQWRSGNVYPDYSCIRLLARIEETLYLGNEAGLVMWMRGNVEFGL